jgi:4-amino-4-deoxy-L-arabinose transferase-like glycosyltransferase
MIPKLTVFVLAFLFLAYKTWAYPLIDADEPRYAQAAKEMINAHQYLIPLADGLPRFDKPILFYWFEILSFKAFGINEFAARLPSVITGALTASFVYWLGSFYHCCSYSLANEPRVFCNFANVNH